MFDCLGICPLHHMVVAVRIYCEDGENASTTDDRKLSYISAHTDCHQERNLIHEVQYGNKPLESPVLYFGNKCKDWFVRQVPSTWRSTQYCNIHCIIHCISGILGEFGWATATHPWAWAEPWKSSMLYRVDVPLLNTGPSTSAVLLCIYWVQHRVTASSDLRLEDDSILAEA